MHVTVFATGGPAPCEFCRSGLCSYALVTSRHLFRRHQLRCPEPSCTFSSLTPAPRRWLNTSDQTSRTWMGGYWARPTRVSPWLCPAPPCVRAMSSTGKGKTSRCRTVRSPRCRERRSRGGGAQFWPAASLAWLHRSGSQLVRRRAAWAKNHHRRQYESSVGARHSRPSVDGYSRLVEAGLEVPPYLRAGLEHDDAGCDRARRPDRVSNELDLAEIAEELAREVEFACGGSMHAAQVRPQSAVHNFNLDVLPVVILDTQSGRVASGSTVRSVMVKTGGGSECDRYDHGQSLERNHDSSSVRDSSEHRNPAEAAWLNQAATGSTSQE